MSKYIGRRVALGVAREATRGTAVAAARWIPRTDFSFANKVMKARVGAGVGNIEDSIQAHILTKWGEGDVSGPVRAGDVGYFLYSLFGTCNTTGPTDSAYAHNFSVENSATHDSLSFTVDNGSDAPERHSLVMLNSLELTAGLEDTLNFSANFMGRTSQTAGAVTPSFVEDYKFTKRHLRVKVADNIASLAAASPISLKELVLTFNANVTKDDSLGTAEPEDFLNQVFSVEGNLSLNYEDKTWENYMRDNTIKAMEIAWINTEETIGAATNPSLTFQFSNVDFLDWEPNYALDEIVTQTVSFKSNRDLTNSNSSVYKAELVNTVASY